MRHNQIHLRSCNRSKDIPIKNNPKSVLSKPNLECELYNISGGSMRLINFSLVVLKGFGFR